MENRINIAELLRKCPEGMELDCVLFDDVVFDEIDDDEECNCPIVIKTKEGETWNLTSTGCWDDSPSAKCVIFPKGKTTWEGFVPPFKFKVGDRIKSIGSDKYYIIKDIKFDRYILNNDCFLRFNDEHIFELVVEPKFKVGDRVRRRHTGETYVIDRINSNGYFFKNEGGVGFTFENECLYELVPNKFDINTLKPFDEVLVRNTNNERWRGQFYMSYDKNEEYPFECAYNCWKQCIPYENNEHLFNKTDDCGDYYKNW